MKQLPISLLAALLLSAATASSQTVFRLGLRGGLNRALTTVDPGGNSTGNYPYSYSTDKTALYAWQAGVVAEFRAGKFAFQPALLFFQKGNQFHTAYYASGVVGYTAQEATGTNRTNWLEVPLNIVYTLHGDHGLQVFGGPYAALAMGGRQRGTRTYYRGMIEPLPAQVTDFDNSITYGTANRRLDAGLNFGIGYRQGPLQVQLSYGLGLLNFYKNSTEFQASDHPDYGRQLSNEVAYNRVAQLTGTYFFSL